MFLERYKRKFFITLFQIIIKHIPNTLAAFDIAGINAEFFAQTGDVDVDSALRYHHIRPNTIQQLRAC